LAWLKKSKKREKELAKRRQKELEEMDKMFQEEYTESMWNHRVRRSCSLTGPYFLEDLHGLKVAHDLEEMADGDEQILTLKDSRILDGQGRCGVLTLSVNSLTRLQRMSFKMSSLLNMSERRSALN
jgi:U4/U6.U5 tri-snRNP-associated protein 1